MPKAIGICLHGASRLHVPLSCYGWVARVETIAAAVASASESVAVAKSKLAEREQTLRRSKEASEINKDEAKSGELASAAKLAELQLQLATELLVLRRAELKREHVAAEVHQVQLSLLNERSKWIAQDARFSDADLQSQLIEIEKQEADLQRSLQSAQSRPGTAIATTCWRERKRRSCAAIRALLRPGGRLHSHGAKVRERPADDLHVSRRCHSDRRRLR